VYLTGAVFSPREVIMKDGMTLGRAIAMAAGVTRQAKGSEVHIYRQKDGKIGSEDMKINYDAIKKGQASGCPRFRLSISLTLGRLEPLLPGTWAISF